MALVYRLGHAAEAIGTSAGQCSSTVGAVREVGRRWNGQDEEVFSEEICFSKEYVPTHQSAVGPQAGHVCLTTGSESSPLLA